MRRDECDRLLDVLDEFGCNYGISATPGIVSGVAARWRVNVSKVGDVGVVMHALGKAGYDAAYDAGTGWTFTVSLGAPEPGSAGPSAQSPDPVSAAAALQRRETPDAR